MHAMLPPIDLLEECENNWASQRVPAPNWELWVCHTVQSPAHGSLLNSPSVLHVLETLHLCEQCLLLIWPSVLYLLPLFVKSSLGITLKNINFDAANCCHTVALAISHYIQYALHAHDTTLWGLAPITSIAQWRCLHGHQAAKPRCPHYWFWLPCLCH